PTAAALAYGFHRQNRKLAVFHMGGGTSDISVLDSGDGVLEVKAVGGDTALGGDDFDQLLVDYLVSAYPEEGQRLLRQDPCALWRLQEAAEQAKKDLSSCTEVRVQLRFLVTDASGPKDLDWTVTRSKFEGLARPLIERCRALVMKTL